MCIYIYIYIYLFIYPPRGICTSLSGRGHLVVWFQERPSFRSYVFLERVLWEVLCFPFPTVRLRPLSTHVWRVANSHLQTGFVPIAFMPDVILVGSQFRMALRVNNFRCGPPKPEHPAAAPQLASPKKQKNGAMHL